MATRSTITVRMSDGTYKSVYCHWDGYEEEPGVGFVLRTYYNSQERAEEVVSLGSLSSLGPTMENPKRRADPTESHTLAYGRDRGDTEGIAPGTGSTPAEAIHNTGYGRQQFNYLWTGESWDRI